MSVQVRVPTPLRRLTNGQEEINGEGGTVGELIDDLENSYSGFKERICDDTGRVRRFVNIYINDEDIRFMDNLETSVKEGDLITIVPAIAGGRLIL